MHKNRKRFQALVLAAAITLAAVPGTGFTARAAEPEIPAETAYPLEPEIPAETAYPSEPEIPAETAYPLEAEEIAADAVDGIALPAVSLNQEKSVFGEIPAEDEIEEDSTNPEDEILPEGDSPEIQEDVSPEPTGGTVSQENPEEDSFPENPGEKGAAENPDQDAASEITEETDPAEIPDQDIAPENPEETDDLETPVQDVDSENLEDTETVTQSVDEVREKTDVEHEDNDLLFEEYAEAVFEEAADGAQPGTSGKGQKNTGDQLTGQDRVIYDALKAAALEIADGQRDSAIVEIPLSELGIDAGKQYTAEDLGLDYIYRRVNGTGEWNPAVGDACCPLTAERFSEDSGRTALMKCTGREVDILFPLVLAAVKGPPEAETAGVVMSCSRRALSLSACAWSKSTGWTRTMNIQSIHPKPALPVLPPGLPGPLSMMPTMPA